jgi:hypothetical protein
MMVDLVCQLDWVMGCPDIWSNIILGVPMRVLVDEREKKRDPHHREKKKSKQARSLF